MKKILRITIIAVLAVLAVLTFVSRTVYNRSLPRVSRVVAVNDRVPIVTVQNTRVNVPWHIEHAYMRVGIALETVSVWELAGITVRTGDPLLRFDTRASDLEIRGAELEILRLEAAVEAGDYLAAAELAHAQDRLAYMRQNAPPAGRYTARASGTIVLEPSGAALPNIIIRNVHTEQGSVFDNVVPQDAIFTDENNDQFVYALDTRRGLFGQEYYVTSIRVIVLRENHTHAAIRAAEDEPDDNRLRGLPLVRDVYGWIQSGDTVWVRER